MADLEVGPSYGLDRDGEQKLGIAASACRAGTVYPDSASDDITLVDGTAHDVKDMHRMGKIQELRRNFRTFSSIAFTSAVMGTWQILLLQNTPALIDGGKAGMFWSTIWVYVGQTFIVLSLAEMSSMAPTAGGQYHWVSEFAPPSTQKILSYTSGWLSMLSWQLFITADSSLAASLILALVNVNNPEFVVKPYMNTLLIIAVTVVLGGLNVYGVRHLPKFEAVFVFFHVTCFFTIVGVLWGLAARSPSREVFLEFVDFNEPGMTWSSTGLALLIGQVPALFTVQGSDSVAHIAEEVQDAGLVVPRAMLAAFFGNMPFAIGILVTYIYTLGDVSEAVVTASGFPFIYALQSCLPTGGVTAIVFIMLLLIFMINLSVVASASRQTFAFARDNGVPFSSWVGRVDRKLQVPVNAIIVSVGFTTIMSLIYLGSATAFNAFISTSVIGLMSTYSISIGCVLYKRVKASFGGPNLPKSRWSLGGWGVPINILGVLFCLESFFWCFWPVANSGNNLNLFNWSVVIFGVVILLACAQYALVARESYTGPVAKVRKE